MEASDPLDYYFDFCPIFQSFLWGGVEGEEGELVQTCARLRVDARMMSPSQTTYDRPSVR